MGNHVRRNTINTLKGEFDLSAKRRAQQARVYDTDTAKVIGINHYVQ